ncbi:MAG TPA: MupA/Atu3671 family FMN-dependent luciferase-like monooxygenase, partial [Myxococcota bacterium]|nr:MupA/Atu3671 family FMN-dependent luciferase-like monooxygenase [Myxococcota bacterium]
QLAHHLVGLGIGPDALVGLYVERSVDMLVSMLGVLKAGGAYVPLDPAYPADRIEYMIQDSGATVVVTQGKLLDRIPASDAVLVAVDRDADEIGQRSPQPPSIPMDPSHLAYVIYTSGSTGKPKGVMVEHRNVVNFFVGMDDRIPHDPPGVWLAVTSLSFDISVLELLWTLTRGFEVVVFTDRQRTAEAGEGAPPPWRPVDFGLALWGSDAGPGPRKYELMLESARFGDERGFRSVHTPERHFGAFGGPFPNPSVTSAAIAAVTSRIEIRASSCVLPLHHPVRVAEEWAVVDNLSGGRVGISFASGWQPNDFVIRPDAFADAKKKLFEGAEAVKRLWRGEGVEFVNPKGEKVETRTLPRPVQSELPAWLTTAGNVETFRAAGEGGFNVLTHLLGQTLEELAEKIKVYRRGRASAGLDPKTGVVTCMLHTYVGEDNDAVRELVRQPMKDYLASAMQLVMGFAWSFPAFERPGGPNSKPEDVDLASLTEEETDAILEFAFERYYETSGLFGTPEICARMVERVKAADIDEIASLIDFGLPTDVVLDGLEHLDRVRREANERPETAVAADLEEAVDDSLPAQVEAYGVTHLQCTPSHATMLLMDPDTRRALSKVEHLMIGGEAFPVSLAADLDVAGCRNVTNMYGPTETTIWSSTQAVRGRPDSISIGRPIANTRLYVLGAEQQPLPIGVAGELMIGGEGVVRGYHERPDLTAERFVPDPFSDRPGARLYRTGDLARWREDGTIDFLGRLDHQVKIRGYRIELGEIEARLTALPSLREAVVIAREDTPGDARLVAYLVPEAGTVAEETLRAALREQLPEFMVPAAFVFLDRMPQTPNGKIDRKALPAPSEVKSRSQAEYKPPGNELESLISEVWKAVLYLDQVGIDDNFFDLGGHSLLVVQAHRKLREECAQPVTLTDLYRFPTIRGLAAHLSSDGEEGEQVKQSQARGEKRRQALG